MFRCNNKIVPTHGLVPVWRNALVVFVPPSANSFRLTFFYFSSRLLCQPPPPKNKINKIRQVNNSMLLCTINNENINYIVVYINRVEVVFNLVTLGTLSNCTIWSMICRMVSGKRHSQWVKETVFICSIISLVCLFIVSNISHDRHDHTHIFRSYLHASD